MENSKISVFIVDDHPIVREGLKSELKKYPHIDLTGEATNGKDALEQIKTTSPDIVLMDMHA